MAANWAASNGHLDVVKWIEYVDSGERTEDMRKKLSAEPLVYKDIENTIISYI
jgi:hypothetical protein